MEQKTLRALADGGISDDPAKDVDAAGHRQTAGGHVDDVERVRGDRSSRGIGADDTDESGQDATGR